MVDFEQVRSYQMADEIVRKLSDLILDGAFSPGARLPGERGLAERFNVSRPTLAKARFVLQALGLVEVRPAAGTYVSRRPTVLSPRLLEYLLRRDEQLMVDLIETRRDFESRNAELAAKNATAKDLQNLMECIQLMECDVTVGRDDFKSDLDFHLGIAEATRNRVRLFMTTSMLLAYLEIRNMARQQMVQRHQGAVQDFFNEHQRIYVAIREGRADQARDAMSAHLEAARMRYLAISDKCQDIGNGQKCQDIVHRRCPG